MNMLAVWGNDRSAFVCVCVFWFRIKQYLFLIKDKALIDRPDTLAAIGLTVGRARESATGNCSPRLKCVAIRTEKIVPTKKTDVKCPVLSV